MALFGKDREKSDRPRALGPEPVVPSHEPAPREVEMFDRDRDRTQIEGTGGTSAFLGKGCRVTGKLQFEGTVRIEGHVEGEISAQDTLIIGESAEVNAQITGSSVVVHGRVTGDITARKRLEIRAPGKLFGNITTPSSASSHRLPPWKRPDAPIKTGRVDSDHAQDSSGLYIPHPDWAVRRLLA